MGLERETKTHTNPDGTTVLVGVEAVIGTRAHIGPDARVLGGTIWGGAIFGGTILGGTIEGGEVHGGVIRGGVIYGGVIYGGVIRGGTIRGGTIRGGAILGGEIEAGTIRGGLVESTEDVVVGGPVGDGPSLITAVPNEDRSGWLIAGGCSRAVPFELDSDNDPFLTEFPPATDGAAAERSAALAFMRTVCQSRQANWGSNSR